VWVPLAAWAAVTRQPAIGLPHLIAIAGSSVLHLGYFVFLHRGYRSGDLSLVYPLSRGVGPLLATAVAITFLGERPSVLALSGAALIVGGAFFLAGGTQSLKRPGAREAARYGIVTGVLIACYTLWDKWGVGTLAIPPLLYDWAVSTGRTILMAPYAMQHREEVREVFRAHWREAVAVAFLSPLSYIMVLTALATSPVSYVAPAREVSILVGTIMGARLLAEADGPRRMAAAAVMVIGVIGLALG
jgi:drug/metabolite transporter (DMT)-like permease